MALMTLTALFEERAQAEQARTDLLAELALAREQLHLHAASGSKAVSPGEHDALLSALDATFTPEEDRRFYLDSLDQGGALIAAEIEQAQVAAALDILDRAGAIDLDRYEAMIPAMPQPAVAGQRESRRVSIAVRSDGLATPRADIADDDVHVTTEPMERRNVSDGVRAVRESVRRMEVEDQSRTQHTGHCPVSGGISGSTR